MAVMTNNIMREPAYGSGPGFCYDVDRSLFRSYKDDGPLVVAIDSNIVLDTMLYGANMINNEPYPPVVDATYGKQLDAWALVIDTWMIRDIRLVVLPGMRNDNRREISDERRAVRERRLLGIESALTFQLNDWSNESRRFMNPQPVDPSVEASIRGVLSPLDANLVLQAMQHQVDVFLTRDNRVVKRMNSLGFTEIPNVMRPTGLARALEKVGVIGSSNAVDIFSGGHIKHRGCIYADGMLMGDSAKWIPLLEAMNDSA